MKKGLDVGWLVSFLILGNAFAKEVQVINIYNNNYTNQQGGVIAGAYAPSAYGNCSRGMVLYGGKIITTSKAIYLPSSRKSDIREGKRQQLICN